MTALRAEWIKYRSLRSLPWTTLSVILLMAGLGAVFSLGRARQAEADPSEFDPTMTSLSGILLAQIAVAVLGVLVITSEHASGTIRSSFAAVPRRSRLLAAKAVMLVLLSTVVGALAGLTAFLIGQPIIGAQGAPSASLADDGVARAVVGAGLYLGVTALLGLALGVLARATAGALTIAMVVLLAVPVFSPVLPAAIAAWVTKWWPSIAALQMLRGVPAPGMLSPWEGLALLAGTVGVVLAAAFLVFRRRDV